MQSDTSVVGEVGNIILDLIFRILNHLWLGIYPYPGHLLLRLNLDIWRAIV